MQDLLVALEEAGWQRLGPEDYPAGTPDPFSLEGDKAKWGIDRADRSHLIELEFHAFGDLGQRTEDVRDIYYCIVPQNDTRLYFEKRGSEKWPQAVAAFVAQLNAMS